MQKKRLPILHEISSIKPKMFGTHVNSFFCGDTGLGLEDSIATFSDFAVDSSIPHGHVVLASPSPSSYCLLACIMRA